MTAKLERVEAIDLGRGASVVIMIMVHTLWLYAEPETQRDSLLGMVLHVFAKGTASFLVAMGFSFMLSRDQTATAAVRRGLQLLGIGYAMNFLKFVVPSTVGFVPDEFILAYGWTPPANAAQLLFMLLTGDILQLAGVCLLMMGLIRKWSARRPTVLLACAGGFAIGTHLLRGTRVGVPGLDTVLDLLWGVEWNVYFPVFPWFAAILVGMILGTRYREFNDPDRLFREVLIAGLPLTAVGLALILAWPDTHFVDFFHLGFGGIVYLVGVNLLLMWFAHLLVRRRSPGRLRALLVYSSERVTSLYVISWVVISWGMAVVGYQTLDAWGVLAAIPVVTGVSYGVRWVFDQFEEARR